MQDLLNLTRDTRSLNRTVDIRPLKVTVANLPDFLVADEEAGELFDTLWAMIFHLNFAVDLIVHPVILAPAKAPEKTSAEDLLRSLGL